MASAIALSSVGYGQSAGPQGYIDIDEFDVMLVIEPAPHPGDPRYEADRAIFRETRSLAGSERYALATNDVQTGASAADRYEYICGDMFQPGPYQEGLRQGQARRPRPPV